MTEAGLKSCVDSMRRNSEHVAKRYMEERPMLMAVDAIDWREVGTFKPIPYTFNAKP